MNLTNKPSSKAVYGLIVSYAALEAAVIVATTFTWHRYAWLVALTLWLISAQTTLLSGWLAFGKGRWWVRLALACLAIAGAYGFWWAMEWFFLPVDRLLFLAAIQAIFTTSALLLTGRLVAAFSAGDLRRWRGNSRWQFSVMDVLIVTTLVAMALPYLVHRGEQSYYEVLSTLPFFIAVAVSACITWPAMASARLGRGVLISLLGVGLTSGAMAALFGSGWPLWYTGFALQGMIVVAFLGALHIVGHRPPWIDTPHEQARSLVLERDSQRI